MLYRVVLAFESVVKILTVIIQMKAMKQYFPVVLFYMLYKMVLTFELVDKNPKMYEGYIEAVLSCGTVCFAVQVVPNFESVDELLKCNNIKAIEAVPSCSTV